MHVGFERRQIGTRHDDLAGFRERRLNASWADPSQLAFPILSREARRLDLVERGIRMFARISLDCIANSAVRIHDAAAADAAQGEPCVTQELQPPVAGQDVMRVDGNVEAEPMIDAERLHEPLSYFRL